MVLIVHRKNNMVLYEYDKQALWMQFYSGIVSSALKKKWFPYIVDNEQYLLACDLRLSFG